MQNQNIPYQKQYTFQERQLECKTIMEKHPETIPIIVERSIKSKLDISDKKKFLFQMIKRKLKYFLDIWS
jgi:hypothetical protein